MITPLMIFLGVILLCGCFAAWFVARNYIPEKVEKPEK